MRFAREAAAIFLQVEIIELHHDQKVDAPSGTALRTAELINEERAARHQGAVDEYEKIPGARGGDFAGMRIHSVRLPGLVAHQEVILGEPARSYRYAMILSTASHLCLAFCWPSIKSEK